MSATRVSCFFAMYRPDRRDYIPRRYEQHLRCDNVQCNPCKWSCWLVRALRSHVRVTLQTSACVPFMTVHGIDIVAKLRCHAVETDDCARWVQLVTHRNHLFYERAFGAQYVCCGRAAYFEPGPAAEGGRVCDWLTSKGMPVIVPA